MRQVPEVSALHRGGKYREQIRGAASMSEQRSEDRRFSLFKWLRCVFTLNHIDPGVAKDSKGVWRCKRCGVSAYHD